LLARKKVSSEKNQTAKTENVIPQSKIEREDKIINSMVNTTVILMSTMMGAFTQVMVSATGAMASGMAEAMGGKEAGDKVNQEIKQNLPAVNEQTKAMISDIRKDIYSQMKQKRKELALLLSDLAFDAGPKIIEEYDFQLPKLTQELDDNALAQYLQLLKSENTRFVKMFSELTKWLSSLPKPPEQNDKKTKNQRHPKMEEKK
jgi:hypothetical protein